MTNKLRIFILGIVLALLSACGGGGGGGGEGVSPPAPPPPTKAILKVSTANVPANTLISAIDFSINLPSGVTPSVLTEINNASGSVAASGKALLVNPSGVLLGSSYAVPIMTSNIASVNGFNSGEFMTITCSIASGTTVTTADFHAPTATSVFDSSLPAGIIIPNATVAISVTLQ